MDQTGRILNFLGGYVRKKGHNWLGRKSNIGCCGLKSISVMTQIWKTKETNKVRRSLARGNAYDDLFELSSAGRDRAVFLQEEDFPFSAAKYNFSDARTALLSKKSLLP